MSLDNTSHAARSGADELAPSRYALRVGEIDVMVVSDGVLSLPGAMLGHNADPAVRAAWLEDMFLPPDVLEWALNVVVVRSAGDAVFRGRVRPPRLVQRLRTRPRRGGPRPGPSFAGAGGDRRGAGGHSPVVPVRLPCGGRR